MMLDSVKLNKNYPLNTLASLCSGEIVEEQVGRCNSWEVGRCQMSSVRPITTTALKNTEPRLSALDPLENAPRRMIMKKEGAYGTQSLLMSHQLFIDSGRGRPLSSVVYPPLSPLGSIPTITQIPLGQCRESQT